MLPSQPASGEPHNFSQGTQTDKPTQAMCVFHQQTFHYTRGASADGTDFFFIYLFFPEAIFLSFYLFIYIFLRCCSFWFICFVCFFHRMSVHQYISVICFLAFLIFIGQIFFFLMFLSLKPQAHTCAYLCKVLWLVVLSFQVLTCLNVVIWCLVMVNLLINLSHTSVHHMCIPYLYHMYMVCLCVCCHRWYLAILSQWCFCQEDSLWLRELKERRVCVIGLCIQTHAGEREKERNCVFACYTSMIFFIVLWD